MLAEIAERKGVLSEFAEYFQLLEESFAEIHILLDVFHKKGIKVIFTRYKPLMTNGSDFCAQIRARGHTFGGTSEEGEFLPNLNPRAEDIVIDKTCDNPFNCTSIDTILSQVGVKNLVVCGVRCPGTVDTFALDAADREYGVIIASDAVAGAVRGCASNLAGGLIRVRSTTAILEMIENL